MATSLEPDLDSICHCGSECECETTPLLQDDRNDLFSSCKCGGSPPEAAPVALAISFNQPTKSDGLEMEEACPLPSQSVELSVTGMTCASCVNAIETYLLNAVDGVQTATVNLLAKRAVVTFDASKVTPETIEKEVSDIGYPSKIVLGKQEGVLAIKVDGLAKQSPAFQQALIDYLESQASIDSVIIDLIDEYLTVNYQAQLSKMRDILDETNRYLSSNSSLRAKLYSGDSAKERFQRKREIRKYRSLFLWCLLFAVPALFFGMVVMLVKALEKPLHKELWQGVSINSFILFLVATPVQFYFGRSFYTNSFKVLRHFRANMDVLIFIGTNAAYFYSIFMMIVGMIRKGFEVETFFETAVLLITFVFLGRYLENLAKGKTSEAITKLLGLRAPMATLLEKDNTTGEVTERIIDSDLLEVGDLVKVAPGQSMPADGEIVLGSSLVNQSMITGESMPVRKETGDSVVCGSVNTVGMVHIRVNKTGSDTTLAKIAKLVEDAQNSKAKIQAFADKLSGHFVPVIIFLSLLTLSTWLVLVYSGAVPSTWLPKSTDKSVFCVKLAIAVLVIACPCALGLATPTAIMVGTGLAAKYHILIKGGAVLERGSKVTAILFDKTGTITTGEPSVTDVVIFDKAVIYSAYSSQQPHSAPEKTQNDESASVIELPSKTTSKTPKSKKQKAKKYTTTAAITSSSPQGTNTSSREDSRVIETISSNTLFWRWLAAVESSSEHPLAKAMMKRANKELGLVEVPTPELGETTSSSTPVSESPSNGKFYIPKVVSFTAISGRGVESLLEDQSTVYVGNRKLIAEKGIIVTKEANRAMVQWEKQGKTAVLVARDQSLIGAVAIADPPRAEASAVISDLKSAGLVVGIVSGDNKRTVKSVAKDLGIERVFAQVLPKHKKRIVETLQKEGHIVAFVGDGINDSPALAQSDVGLAIGAGTDIAIESASMVLMRSDLSDIDIAFKIARKTYRRIKINFAWAFGYNVLAIPIAAGVFFAWIHKTLPPWIAGLAMALSSVSVVLSSLELKLYKPKRRSQRST